MFDRFDRRQIVKLTFLWIAAVCVTALLLPLFALLERPLLAYFIGGAGLLVVVRSIALLKLEVLDRDGVLAADLRAIFVRSCRIRFMEINTFVLVVSILLVVDAMV